MPPSPAFTDSSSPGQAGDASRRVTWPDVAVLVAVIGFDIFLISRGLSIRSATITAVATAASVLSLLLLPRRFAEAVKLIRAISRAVTPPGNGGA